MVEIKEFPELTFEESKHIYKIDGVIAPSVTTLMKALSDKLYSTIDPDVLAKAAAKGTAVHGAIESFINNGIDGDIEPDYKPYYDAFRAWYDDYKVKPYGSEIRLYHKELRYAGTTDLLANVNGVDTLIDFKTSVSVSRALCAVQLEAYERALNSHHSGDGMFGQKMIVQICKDGTYNVFDYKPNDTEAWRVLTALLTIHSYKQKL